MGVHIDFPGKIKTIPPTCRDYSTVTQGNSLTINTNSSGPIAPCKLIVNEGPKRSRRHHVLILIYSQNFSADEQYRDYSTKELLAKRIAHNQTFSNAGNIISTPKVRRPFLGIGRHKRAPKKSEHQFVAPTPAEAMIADSAAIPGYTMGRVNLKVKNMFNGFNGFFYYCELLVRKESVDTAMRYLLDVFQAKDNTRVEINRLNHEPERINARQYLTSLSELPFRNIKISNSKLAYVGNFYQGKDKKWYGTAVITQDFKGLSKDGGLPYSEGRNITFKLVLEKIQGEAVPRIMLGDMLVTQVQ